MQINNLFDHCADHHMSKSNVVTVMHNTIVYIYLHTKLIFLYAIQKYTDYQKKPLCKMLLCFVVTSSFPVFTRLNIKHNNSIPVDPDLF